MHLKTSTLLSLALGAALIAAPNLGKIGADVAYDQAFAAKGGNGKGNGGNGNAGGKSANSSASSKSGNKGGGSKSAKPSGSTEDETSLASLDGSSKKTKGPDHPSSLGRWNATKDFEHPSIQAHIRNGNFTGTMGLLARFGLALNTYGGVQEQAAAAQQASADLAAALQTANYGMTTGTFDLNAALAEYDAAVSLDPTKANATIDGLIDANQAVPSAEELAAAQAELTAVEEEMAAASNRSSWEEVRSVVIDRLGLEDVTVTEPTTPTDTTTPTEPSEPVTEPVL
jgi:hypothetical protein